jgi:hypothetical protein
MGDNLDLWRRSALFEHLRDGSAYTAQQLSKIMQADGLPGFAPEQVSDYLEQLVTSGQAERLGGRVTAYRARQEEQR